MVNEKPVGDLWALNQFPDQLTPAFNGPTKPVTRTGGCSQLMTRQTNRPKSSEPLKGTDTV